MPTQPTARFILTSSSPAGPIYLAQPGGHGVTWIAYDLQAGGVLANPRPIEAVTPANWRGLPELR
ncbi:MAG: hypothetical protein ACKVZ0_10590 [Gemmatimonadales bacterium]